MVKKPSPFHKSFVPVHRLLRRTFSGRHQRRSTTATTKTPPIPQTEKLQGQTVVVDVEAWLLRSPLSTFPYFMLVAVEAGSFLRGLLLLLVYPLLRLVSHDMRFKAMVMVSFMGLREKEVVRVCKAVLPKFFLEDMAMEGLEAVKKARTVVAMSTSYPRVMVKGFLREYIGVDAVVGREMMTVAGRYIGVIEDEVLGTQNDQGLVWEETEEMDKGKGDRAVGLVGMSTRMHHLFFHHCKETFVVTEEDKAAWQPLPRDKYPKPLVFHDGRLAFKPTFSAAVAMYTYLPFGLFLAVFRSVAYSILPYGASVPLGAITGMRSRIIAGPTQDATLKNQARGRLYVCNHRTLLDPITVAAGLNKPVTAVTYSVSSISELIAPIPTTRLTRDRDEDRRRMVALLARGDLVVCPEGTTCREPYLLRFSPLFAELTGEVTPVALDTRVDMFYGTSTKPVSKVLDPLYFMMNPRPEYRVEFLERVVTTPAADTLEGDHGQSSSIHAANRVQRVLGDALDFELTTLTRKDKYMMLAGNEGFVRGEAKN